MGKADLNKNFRCDEELDAFIGSILVKTDCRFTEYVKAAMIFFAPFAEKKPHWVKDILNDWDRESQQNNRKTGRISDD